MRDNTRLNRSLATLYAILLIAAIGLAAYKDAHITDFTQEIWLMKGHKQ